MMSFHRFTSTNGSDEGVSRRTFVKDLAAGGAVAGLGLWRTTAWAQETAPVPWTTLSGTEFDLDLGNPLQDVVGFVIHMGELLDSTITNHLDLRKTLAKSIARQFLYYSIAAATATSSPSRTRRRA